MISDLIDSSSCNHEDTSMKYSLLVCACKRNTENSYVSLYNDEPSTNIKSSIMALDSKGKNSSSHIVSYSLLESTVLMNHIAA